MAKKLKYIFRRASTLDQSLAQEAGERLHSLAKGRGVELGALSPQEVLEDAKSRQSPLHDLFEWDDSTAAGKYRLWQARVIVNSIREVEYDDLGHEEQSRVFVSLRPYGNDDDEDEEDNGENGDRQYFLVRDARNDPATQLALLEEALRRFLALRERYEDLFGGEPKELAAIFTAIDRAVKTNGLKAA